MHLRHRVRYEVTEMLRMHHTCSNYDISSVS